MQCRRDRGGRSMRRRAPWLERVAAQSWGACKRGAVSALLAVRLLPYRSRLTTIERQLQAYRWPAARAWMGKTIDRVRREASVSHPTGSAVSHGAGLGPLRLQALGGERRFSRPRRERRGCRARAGSRAWSRRRSASGRGRTCRGGGAFAPRGTAATRGGRGSDRGRARPTRGS